MDWNRGTGRTLPHLANTRTPAPVGTIFPRVLGLDGVGVSPSISQLPKNSHFKFPLKETLGTGDQVALNRSVLLRSPLAIDLRKLSTGIASTSVNQLKKP